MRKIIAVPLALLVALVLVMAGAFVSAAHSTECVPSPAYTQLTDFGTSNVAPGPGWYLWETRKVTDKAASDKTVVETPAVAAQHYSLKGNSGIGKYETPVFPADYWQANATKEPHGSKNITWLNTVGSGLHYASHGSKGKRDWFYFQPAVPAVTEVVHHDAVTHLEYQFAIDRKAVTCTGIPQKPQAVWEFDEHMGCAWDLAKYGHFKSGAIYRNGLRDYVWTGSKWVQSKTVDWDRHWHQEFAWENNVVGDHAQLLKYGCIKVDKPLPHKPVPHKPVKHVQRHLVNHHAATLPNTGGGSLAAAGIGLLLLVGGAILLLRRG